MGIRKIKIKKKRGAIEVQFNWVFILIIGAIILLFFFSVVKTQKKISETKISSSVRRDITSIFTGASISTNTFSLIEIPKTEIIYDCEGYSIQKTNPIKQLVSFSPDTIYSSQLMLWALPWNIGYRVTNFLYITSPNIRYVMVYKDNKPDQHMFVDILNETLPSKYIEEDEDRKILMNKEKAVTDGNKITDLQDNDFEDKNNPKVRFIFFDENPIPIDIDVLEGMDNYDVTAVQIIPDNSCGDELDCFGEVIFYKKTNNNKFEFYNQNRPSSNSYYIGLPSLIGAAFGDLETYECNMENAFQRLQLVTQVYLNKTKTLKQYYTDNLNYPCITIMGEVETVLQSILSYSDSFNEDNIEDIYDGITSLEDLNDRAIRLSCSEIY